MISTSLPDYLRKQAYRSRLAKARQRTALRQVAAPNILAEARNNLTAFKRLIYKRYKHAPHLEALDEKLSQVVRFIETGGEEGIGRLIIEMPPRHGKTMTVSRLFPAWFLGRNPDCRVMLVSYGASLAHKNSRLARNLIPSPRYQAVFNINLSPGSRRVDTWDIAGHEGGCDALGIGGGAAGKGAHLLIIDDPIKNREQAESATYRDKIWDAFTDDLYTRLEPGGAIIIMATRWHQDDMTGRALKFLEELWTRLRLPAIAEEKDPIGRKEGEPLWAERFPLRVLQQIMATLGLYGWASLYQQAPTPAEGGIFKRKWFHKLQRLPEMRRVVRFWDLAMSEKTTADYTVGLKLGEGVDGHLYVMDIARRQLEWGDVPEFMVETILADGPNVRQGIEQKGYMSRAVQQLNKDPRLHGYVIRGYPKAVDKVTNALPFAARCAADLVHVLESHFTESFIEETCAFPNAAHDDQVDAAAGAYEMLGERKGNVVTETENYA